MISLAAVVSKIDLSLFQVPIKLTPRMDMERTFIGSDRARVDEWLLVELTIRDRDDPTLEKTIATSCPVEFPFQSEIDAVRWIYRKVYFMVMHELTEAFIFDGKRIFDPHDPKAERP